jgi:hypothetical protein
MASPIRSRTWNGSVTAKRSPTMPYPGARVVMSATGSVRSSGVPIEGTDFMYRQRNV